MRRILQRIFDFSFSNIVHSHFVLILFSNSITSLYSQNSLSTQQLLGQVNTITSAVPFLLFTPDARSGGLGETGVATSPDIFSNHYNAAKSAFAEHKIAFGASYSPSSPEFA